VAACAPQVCRHHAAAVARGHGNQASARFECPYHGWTYGERVHVCRPLPCRGVLHTRGVRAALSATCQPRLHRVCVCVGGWVWFTRVRRATPAQTTGAAW
jgi:phenylpropionate dioxygenase-like ring-hydroxylating dioxygenase large terminal subunit